MNEQQIRNLFNTSIALTVGRTGTPLCGFSLDEAPPDPPELSALVRFFSMIPNLPEKDEDESLWAALGAGYGEAERIFIDYYMSRPEKFRGAERALAEAADDQQRAEAVARLWLPELNIPEHEITPRWKLSDVKPNPRPIQPKEVTIQLNALYTVPETEPSEDLPDRIREIWEQIRNDPGEKVADYDHPVPIFEGEDHHELLKCLDELDRDMAFEKRMGVLPEDHRILITLSVSVTHRDLDHLCMEWLKHLLDQKHYEHLTILLLTEESIAKLKKEVLKQDFSVFSVLGKYGRHFNALKYMQLILEKTHGIRAGFKLDTDEGIHSEDLHGVTGKTWLQTMCHPLWSGTARDRHGREVELAVNEGEYINSTDADRMGYAGSLREPDVKKPGSYGGPSIFFHKGFAHAKATQLYNTFDSLDDHISHPVVKGGGYGITNEGLKKAVPFTFSEVGRAEDQQFYFAGVAKGIRGIFHPNLRILHYKSSVAKSEDKTAATRFIGDLYRLVIFQHLVEMLDVKEELDPMPGAFAGPLARCQAYFHMILTAFVLFRQGKTEEARTILVSGFEEIGKLKQQIDSGEIRSRWHMEQEEWTAFAYASAGIDDTSARRVIDEMTVG